MKYSDLGTTDDLEEASALIDLMIELHPNPKPNRRSTVVTPPDNPGLPTKVQTTPSPLSVDWLLEGVDMG